MTHSELELGKKVTLVWIEGEDAAEFSDLIGSSGILKSRPNGNINYYPEGRSDWLTIQLSSYVEEKFLRITSNLQNVFVFRTLV